MRPDIKLFAEVDEQKLAASVRRAIQRSERDMPKLRARIDEKAYTQPLGRITGKANEFKKSMEASNARVIAFGASTAIIYGVQKAFREMIKTTIQVEATLADINSILNQTTAGMEKFSRQLFTISKDTGQSFYVTAQAAQELARQGLSAEQTLIRVSDAMKLTRLSGMQATQSVASLTAIINSFKNEVLTTTDIVNRLANVETGFAISSGDLANAIGRVGSAAQDAGVDLNQLMAIVTTAQQMTARGGSVIGNSFKTIFTRLQRSSTLDQLRELGVETRKLDGSLRNTVDILGDLARSFDTLSQEQQAHIAELVGGVFQINILKATLGDLNREYSVYNNVLKRATDTSDEAIKRNEKLNQTLKSRLNVTLNESIELAQKLGNIGFSSNLQLGIDLFNKGIGSLNKGLDGEGIGGQIGKSIIKGIGNILTGPGAIAIGFVISRLFVKTSMFALKSFSQLSGMNAQSEKQKAIQESINITLKQHNTSYGEILAKTRSKIGAEQEILRLVKERVSLEKSAGYHFSALASSSTFANQRKGDITTASSGLIPSMVKEKRDVVRGVGGARPHAKPVVLPNFNFGGGQRGTVVANSDEYIINNYMGGNGSAIFNRDMVNTAGGAHNLGKLGSVRKIAAGGHVPNYAKGLVREGAFGSFHSLNKTKDGLPMGIKKYLYGGSGQNEFYHGRALHAGIISGQEIGKIPSYLYAPKMFSASKKGLVQEEIKGRDFSSYLEKAGIYDDDYNYAIESFLNRKISNIGLKNHDYNPGNFIGSNKANKLLSISSAKERKHFVNKPLDFEDYIDKGLSGTSRGISLIDSDLLTHTSSLGSKLIKMSKNPRLKFSSKNPEEQAILQRASQIMKSKAEGITPDFKNFFNKIPPEVRNAVPNEKALAMIHEFAGHPDKLEGPKFMQQQIGLMRGLKGAEPHINSDPDKSTKIANYLSKRRVDTDREARGAAGGYTPNYVNKFLDFALNETNYPTVQNYASGSVPNFIDFEKIRRLKQAGKSGLLGSGLIGSFYSLPKKIDGKKIGVKLLDYFPDVEDRKKEASKEFFNSKFLSATLKTGKDKGLINPAIDVPYQFGSAHKQENRDFLVKEMVEGIELTDLENLQPVTHILDYMKGNLSNIGVNIRDLHSGNVMIDHNTASMLNGLKKRDGFKPKSIDRLMKRVAHRGGKFSIVDTGMLRTEDPKANFIRKLTNNPSLSNQINESGEFADGILGDFSEEDKEFIKLSSAYLGGVNAAEGFVPNYARMKLYHASNNDSFSPDTNRFEALHLAGKRSVRGISKGRVGEIPRNNFYELDLDLPKGSIIRMPDLGINSAHSVADNLLSRKIITQKEFDSVRSAKNVYGEESHVDPQQKALNSILKKKGISASLYLNTVEGGTLNKGNKVSLSPSLMLFDQDAIKGMRKTRDISYKSDGVPLGLLELRKWLSKTKGSDRKLFKKRMVKIPEMGSGFLPNYALGFKKLGEGGIQQAHEIIGDPKYKDYIVKSPKGPHDVDAFLATRRALIKARRLSKKQNNFEILNPINTSSSFVNEELRGKINKRFGQYSYLQRKAPGESAGYTNRDVQQYLNDAADAKDMKLHFGDFHSGNWTENKKGKAHIFDLYANDTTRGVYKSDRTSQLSKGFVPNYALGFNKLGAGVSATAYEITGDPKLSKYVVKAPHGWGARFDGTHRDLIQARRLSKKQTGFKVLNPIPLSANFINKDSKRDIIEKFGASSYLQLKAPGKRGGYYNHDVEDTLNDLGSKKGLTTNFGDFHEGNWNVDDKGKEYIFDLSSNLPSLKKIRFSSSNASFAKGFVPNFNLSKLDKRYFEFLRSGNNPDAHKILDEIRTKGGLFNLQGYHGTPTGGFTVFDTELDRIGEQEDGSFISNVSGPDPSAFIGSHFAIGKGAKGVANQFKAGLYRGKHNRSRPQLYKTWLGFKNPKSYNAEEFEGAVLLQSVITNQDFHGDWFDDNAGEFGVDGANPFDLLDSENGKDILSDMYQSYTQQGLNYEDGGLSDALEVGQDIRSELVSNKHDGIIYDNFIEGGEAAIAFNPQQIKSANLITRFGPEDKLVKKGIFQAGKIIPPSMRFSSSPDIRFAKGFVPNFAQKGKVFKRPFLDLLKDRETHYKSLSKRIQKAEIHAHVGKPITGLNGLMHNGGFADLADLERNKKARDFLRDELKNMYSFTDSIGSLSEDEIQNKLNQFGGANVNHAKGFVPNFASQNLINMYKDLLINNYKASVEQSAEDEFPIPSDRGDINEEGNEFIKLSRDEFVNFSVKELLDPNDREYLKFVDRKDLEGIPKKYSKKILGGLNLRVKNERKKKNPIVKSQQKLGWRAPVDPLERKKNIYVEKYFDKLKKFEFDGEEYELHLDNIRQPSLSFESTKGFQPTHANKPFAIFSEVMKRSKKILEHPNSKINKINIGGASNQLHRIYKKFFQRPRDFGNIELTKTEYLDKLKARGFAKGFTPNFSNPLKDSLQREYSALRDRGIPSPQAKKSIFVDRDPRVGVGVGNMFDEPSGRISQGVNRELRAGRNPKTSGMVPNFAVDLKQFGDDELEDIWRRLDKKGEIKSDPKASVRQQLSQEMNLRTNPNVYRELEILQRRRAREADVGIALSKFDRAEQRRSNREDKKAMAAPSSLKGRVKEDRVDRHLRIQKLAQQEEARVRRDPRSSELLRRDLQRQETDQFVGANPYMLPSMGRARVEKFEERASRRRQLTKPKSSLTPTQPVVQNWVPEAEEIARTVDQRAAIKSTLKNFPQTSEIEDLKAKYEQANRELIEANMEAEKYILEMRNPTSQKRFVDEAMARIAPTPTTAAATSTASAPISSNSLKINAAKINALKALQKQYPELTPRQIEEGYANRSLKTRVGGDNETQSSRDNAVIRRQFQESDRVNENNLLFNKFISSRDVTFSPSDKTAQNDITRLKSVLASKVREDFGIKEGLKLDPDIDKRISKEANNRFIQMNETRKQKILDDERMTEDQRRMRVTQGMMFASMGLSALSGAIPQDPDGRGAGAVASSSMQMASMGIMMGSFAGPKGAAVGGIVMGAIGGFKKAVDGIAPSLQNATKKFEELSSSVQNNTNSATEFLRSFSDLNERLRNPSSSPSDVRTLRRQMVTAYSSIEDPMLRREMFSKGGNISEMQEVFAKFQEEQQRAIQRESLAVTFGNFGKEYGRMGINRGSMTRGDGGFLSGLAGFVGQGGKAIDSEQLERLGKELGRAFDFSDVSEEGINRINDLKDSIGELSATSSGAKFREVFELMNVPPDVIRNLTSSGEKMAVLSEMLDFGEQAQEAARLAASQTKATTALADFRKEILKLSSTLFSLENIDNNRQQLSIQSQIQNAQLFLNNKVLEDGSSFSFDPFQTQQKQSGIDLTNLLFEQGKASRELIHGFRDNIQKLVESNDFNQEGISEIIDGKLQNNDIEGAFQSLLNPKLMDQGFTKVSEEAANMAREYREQTSILSQNQKEQLSQLKIQSRVQELAAQREKFKTAFGGQDVLQLRNDFLSGDPKASEAFNRISSLARITQQRSDIGNLGRVTSRDLIGPGEGDRISQKNLFAQREKEFDSVISDFSGSTSRILSEFMSQPERGRTFGEDNRFIDARNAIENRREVLNRTMARQFGQGSISLADVQQARERDRDLRVEEAQGTLALSDMLGGAIEGLSPKMAEAVTSARATAMEDMLDETFENLLGSSGVDSSLREQFGLDRNMGSVLDTIRQDSGDRLLDTDREAFLRVADRIAEARSNVPAVAEALGEGLHVKIGKEFKDKLRDQFGKTNLDGVRSSIDDTFKSTKSVFEKAGEQLTSSIRVEKELQDIRDVIAATGDVERAARKENELNKAISEAEGREALAKGEERKMLLGSAFVPDVKGAGQALTQKLGVLTRGQFLQGDTWLDKEFEKLGLSGDGLRNRTGYSKSTGRVAGSQAIDGISELINLFDRNATLGDAIDEFNQGNSKELNKMFGLIGASKRQREEIIIEIARNLINQDPEVATFQTKKTEAQEEIARLRGQGVEDAQGNRTGGVAALREEREERERELDTIRRRQAAPANTSLQLLPRENRFTRLEDRVFQRMMADDKPMFGPIQSERPMFGPVTLGEDRQERISRAKELGTFDNIISSARAAGTYIDNEGNVFDPKERLGAHPFSLVTTDPNFISSTGNDKVDRFKFAQQEGLLDGMFETMVGAGQGEQALNYIKHAGKYGVDLDERYTDILNKPKDEQQEALRDLIAGMSDEDKRTDEERKRDEQLEVTKDLLKTAEISNEHSVELLSLMEENLEKELEITHNVVQRMNVIVEGAGVDQETKNKITELMAEVLGLRTQVIEIGNSTNTGKRASKQT